MSHGSNNGTGGSANSTGGTTNSGGGQLSLRDLCCLFCCPPCPSNIVAKLAFMPPDSTYKLIQNDTGSHVRLELKEGLSEWPYGSSGLSNVEVFYWDSSRGNRIACMYIGYSGPAPSSPYTILFSHGNAVDLGQMSSFYYGIGLRLKCNVFSYDYSGYGCSSGKASEKNLYADISSAWLGLKSRYGVTADKVILYGQSIGTVPTIDLASRMDVAAVVLHSPLMSGMRVAFPDTRRTWCIDAFPSIEKIETVNSPTLVIHGTEDEVIDFSHGLSIFERCPRAVEPLWVPGAGHNDVELYAAYLERLKEFIDHEIPQYHATDSADSSGNNGTIEEGSTTSNPHSTQPLNHQTANNSTSAHHHS